MRGTSSHILEQLRKNENVVSPSHYTSGSIEVLDIISSALGKAGFEAFCMGQVLKYTIRAKHKSKYFEDMQKAQFYLSILLGDDPRKKQD